jgi:hypothetical protein
MQPALTLDVERWALEVDVCIELIPFGLPQAVWQTGLSASRGKKMLQFKACHICLNYCILYVHTDSHAITCC